MKYNIWMFLLSLVLWLLVITIITVNIGNQWTPERLMLVAITSGMAAILCHLSVIHED